MFVVVTTFSGRKPPSTYYERLRRLGIRPDNSRVRFTASVSLAVAIAQLAQRYGGAAFVFPIDSAIDHEGERLPGPLPEASGKDSQWVVTCYECARSFQAITTGSAPKQCPVCLSLAVHSRPGRLRPATAPLNADPFTQWVCSRFSTGWLTFPTKVTFVRGVEVPPVEDEWKQAVDEIAGMGLATMEEMDAAVCLLMYPFLRQVVKGDTLREQIFQFIARRRRQ